MTCVPDALSACTSARRTIGVGLGITLALASAMTVAAPAWLGS